ncbi:anthranilate synthase component I [Crocosphaera subtropica ATCC 51142]|uniref:Anthranilate synthase component 1 n=1 Tax=Crocosphaera subtropica (strain ATCC 51142 / BH68) TaxID=43989 RepID=B1WYY5_CROS5|nr:anthranilate synthase component I [Crocosphaera subtropica]ACB52749.1 anthranilate synthase component I [Crocosphaera subtropica ATCC 51142]
MTHLLSWHWRSLPLKNLTGSEVFERLFASDATIATLLESPFPTPSDYPYLSRYSICAGEPSVIDGQPQLWTPKLGNVLPFLQQLLTQKTDQSFLPEHLPFVGGWLGWLGYDLAWEIESLPHYNHDPLPFPVAYWYAPESFAILDHLEQKLWLASYSLKELDNLQSKLETKTYSLPYPLKASPSHLCFYTHQKEYENAVRQAKKYIQAGDIFQANLSLRFQSTTSLTSWQLYKKLQQINPSPFASYWRSPWGDMISCSPERLVSLNNKIAQTRPIAGTRPRGQNFTQETAMLMELSSDIKERAEHIMLVDLERNDLGKVCQWGSVEVDELLTIERYSHVIHLVSNIKGKLHQNKTSIDLIKALFPGGTITGCPKVRCLEIIEELEPVKRNLFYGSCGYLDYRGNVDLNILIRTLLYTPLSSNLSSVWGQVGAGIVADSHPEKEWFESLQKAKAQLKALNL